MDLVTLPFRLPFLPLQELIRLAELIQEEAESQYYDPVAAQRLLEEAADAHARDEISSEELYQTEVEAIARASGPAGGAAGPGTAGEE